MTVTLDFLAAQQQQILAEMRLMREDMAFFRAEMASFRDDMRVITALVIRVDNEAARLRDRVARLETKQTTPP